MMGNFCKFYLLLICGVFDSAINCLSSYPYLNKIFIADYSRGIDFGGNRRKRECRSILPESIVAKVGVGIAVVVAEIHSLTKTRPSGIATPVHRCFASLRAGPSGGLFTPPPPTCEAHLWMISVQQRKTHETHHVKSGAKIDRAHESSQPFGKVGKSNSGTVGG